MRISPAACDKRDDSRACSAWYIARELGHPEWSVDRALRQIAALIAAEGFPPPIALRDCTARSRRLVDGLSIAARWRVDAVQAWLDGGAWSAAALDPAIAGGADRAAIERAAQDLDARAAQFAGGAL